MKAGTPDRIVWTMELLVDFFISGAVKADQLGVRYLSGQITGSGGKGIVDLMCLKKDMLNYVVSTFMDAHPYTVQEKTMMREMTSDIDMFRSKCGYLYNVNFKKVSYYNCISLKCFCPWRAHSIVIVCHICHLWAVEGPQCNVCK